MSKVDEQEISHSEYISGKYALTSLKNGRIYARVYIDDNGDIEPRTYSRAYLKSINENESSSTKQKKSRNYDKEEGYCVKMLFTIIPILPIWWVIKMPFSIITYPFRYLFSSDNTNVLPRYSFKKF